MSLIFCTPLPPHGPTHSYASARTHTHTHTHTHPSSEHVQWERALRIMEKALVEHNIGYVALNGAATTSRTAAREFKMDPEKKVFLLTGKQQASGLTLVSATHVFLMEPILNKCVVCVCVCVYIRVHAGLSICMCLRVRIRVRACLWVRCARTLTHLRVRERIARKPGKTHTRTHTRTHTHAHAHTHTVHTHAHTPFLGRWSCRR